MGILRKKPKTETMNTDDSTELADLRATIQNQPEKKN